MLDVEVKPGKSLGEFKLGMPLPHAIAYIQKNYKNIPAVELKYCEEDMLTTFILVDLVEEGILLRFEPRTQTLVTIEVYDLMKVILRYSNVAFSGPETIPTFVLIYSRFGPSFPGDFDKKTRIYTLHYPGISFAFLIPPQFEVLDETELPLEFGDGTTPLTTSMTLYSGSKEAPTLPRLLTTDSYYFEEVHVLVSKCIYFTRRGCKLDFYSTAQDVVSELGRPDRIFYKVEDKMRIHSGDKSVTDTVCEDYFYNYFAIGLDILFDMQSHVVKKFILHTNFPCHYDFNVYVKCNYRLFFEESPFFGKPLSDTPLSSPDVFKRKGDAADGDATLKMAKQERSSSGSTRHSLDNVLESLAEEEEEEGRLIDRRKEREVTKHLGNNNNNSNNKAKAGKNKKRKKKRNGESWKERSLLGEALMREGVLREEDVGDQRNQKGEKETEKEKEKENETVQDGETEKEKGEEKSRDGEYVDEDTYRKRYHHDGSLRKSDQQIGMTTTTTTDEGKGKERLKPGQFNDIEPPRLIHPDMQWDEIKDMLPGGDPRIKPLVHSVGATASPFGSTRFFGHKDIIFEVMRNQHIASVCLFSSATRGSN